LKSLKASPDTHFNIKKSYAIKGCDLADEILNLFLRNYQVWISQNSESLKAYMVINLCDWSKYTQAGVSAHVNLKKIMQ
jgi:hypothetical protein